MVCINTFSAVRTTCVLLVRPTTTEPCLTASCAYSTWNIRPCGELKTVNGCLETVRGWVSQCDGVVVVVISKHVCGVRNRVMSERGSARGSSRCRNSGVCERGRKASMRRASINGSTFSEAAEHQPPSAEGSPHCTSTCCDAFTLPPATVYTVSPFSASRTQPCRLLPIPEQSIITRKSSGPEPYPSSNHPGLRNGGGSQDYHCALLRMSGTQLLLDSILITWTGPCHWISSRHSLCRPLPQLPDSPRGCDIRTRAPAKLDMLKMCQSG